MPIKTSFKNTKARNGWLCYINGLSEIEIKELAIIAHFWTMKIIRKRNSSNGKLFMLPPNKIEKMF